MTDDTARADMLAALEGRTAFYNLLAALYYKPLTQEQIDGIAAMDTTPFEGVNDLFDQGLDDIRRHLVRTHSGTRQELAVDFTAAFAGTSSWEGRYAVPYESVFSSPEGLLLQEAYHKVYHLYRQAGLRTADGYDFPDDHLSYMCGFLSALSQRIAHGIEAKDYQQAIEQIVLSRAFLHDHVLSWFDDFQELALKLLQTRFYRGVLKLTKGFFLLDEQVLDDLEKELRSL